MSKDYYNILGVDKSASSKEVRSAYNKLAKKHHPDLSKDPQSESKFAEINEAYGALKDPKKREQYDRYGSDFANNSRSAPGGGFSSGGFSFNSESGGEFFSDLFSNIFGASDGASSSGRRGGGQSGHRKGSDLLYEFPISLNQAFNTQKVSVAFEALTKCNLCEGTGSRTKQAAKVCNDCRGSGVTTISRPPFAFEQTCNSCKGLGVQSIDDPCHQCSGQGSYIKKRNLDIDIPRGVFPGCAIRIAGQGEPAKRGLGKDGDLKVAFMFTEHPFFKYKDQSSIRAGDLYCEVPIKLTTALLGGEIIIPSLEGGKLSVDIPRCTQSGKVLSLKGKGMFVPGTGGGRRGNLYINIQIELPITLTTKQEELIREFDKLSSQESQPKIKKFFLKIKDFLQN